MKYLLFFFILVLFVLCSQSFQDVKKDQKLQKQVNINENQLNIINMNQQNLKTQQKQQGVIILTQKNFEHFLKQFQYLVIYFQSQQCKYCKQFSITYIMLCQHYSRYIEQSQFNNKISQIKFAKLKLNSNTESIFKRYNIQQVPQIRITIKGNLLYYRFKNLQYDDIIIEEIQEWIERVIMIEQSQNVLFKRNQVNNLDQIKDKTIKRNQFLLYPKIIVFNCYFIYNDQTFKIFLKSILLEYLDHNFYCIKSNNQHQQISNEIIFNIYKIYQNIVQDKKLLQLSQFSTLNLSKQIKYQLLKSQNTPQTLLKYKLNFKRYINSQVQQWSLKSIQKIFVQHQSAFILLTNNQTKSQKAFQHYKFIKNQINQNQELYSPAFYYSDLSVTPQQSTKIKKYIIGSQMGIQKRYMYPVLAYLKFTGRKVSKYVFPLNRMLIYKNMKYWIVSVIKKLELVQSSVTDHTAPVQQQNSVSIPIQIEQYFMSTPQSAFPKVKIPSQFTEQDFKPTTQLQLINYEDFKLLLSPQYKASFFIYINWRNDMFSYRLIQQMRKWWIPSKQDEGQQNNEEQNQKEILKVQQENLKEKQEGNEMNKNEVLQQKLNKEPENQIKQDEQNDQQVTQEQIDTLRDKVNIWILNLNINDYPRTYKDAKGKQHQILIQYVPSFLYFSKDKTIMNIIQGIKDLRQIQEFIIQNINKEQSQKQQQMQVKVQQHEQNTEKLL